MAAHVEALELEWVRPRARRLPSLLRLARRKYLGTVSLLVLVAVAATAIFAPWVAPHNPIAVHTDQGLAPPSLQHLFGTDELGRDLLSRVIYGARVSLTVGITSVAFGAALGIPIGLTSAFFGGKYDLFVQRFIDSLQAFPSLVLAMVMVATLGDSLQNVILAIGITFIAWNARITRATAMSVQQNLYVDAARVVGASNWRIMFRYVLANSWAPIIVTITTALGAAIIREASLSFLGLGPPPPNPTWGSMLSGSARNYMQTAPWMALAPGIAITITVLAFNLLGDAVRDVLDPRLRGT
jgi:peptide/nickel transport system permease protein